MEDEVGEDVECGGYLLVEDLDVEADHLFAGESVEISADGVDFSGDLLCRARGCSLEDHVLDEMRDTIDLRGFIAGAGSDPCSHGDTAKVRHALGEDRESVGKDRLSDIARRTSAEVRLFDNCYWHAAPYPLFFHRGETEC